MIYCISSPSIKSEKCPVLIVLHGYGADERDLMPIAETIAEGPGLLIISLQAPIPLPQGGYAWYRLEQTDQGLIPDDLSRHESEDMLLHSLHSIIEQEGGDPEQIVFMGFSQGAAVCYSLLTVYQLGNYGLKAQAAITMSGYLPRDILGPLSKKQFSGFPFFISHGEFDDLVPAMALNEAETLLTQQGARVTARMYDVGHGVLPETVGDIAMWISKEIINYE
jgi:phospholipase/carboxylesterase